MIKVPEALLQHAAAVGADNWLSDLPGIVRTLEERWELTVERPFPAATEAYVAEATTSAGRPVVLKLLVPTSGERTRHEITALRLAAGQGCVALLRDDPDLGALLLERLGPSLLELGLPITRRHEILCDTAARMWRPASDSGLPTGVDRARLREVWVAESWEALGRPCSERAIEYALSCASRRAAAHDDARALLVHGDVHQLNVLWSGPEFKLVDPDGLLAEPECDLGTVMRGDPVDLLRGDPLERAHRLAARAGLDPTAIWEWGVIERVASGLHCTEIGLQPLGRQTLAAADAAARLDLAR